jgi:hypothetical protein
MPLYRRFGTSVLSRLLPARVPAVLIGTTGAPAEWTLYAKCRRHRFPIATSTRKPVCLLSGANDYRTLAGATRLTVCFGRRRPATSSCSNGS